MMNIATMEHSSMPLRISMLEWMRVMQFGDSMLPIGAFSFSHGLESAFSNNVVNDYESLQSYVRTALRQAAMSDGIALLVAMRAAAQDDQSLLIAADKQVFNRKLNEEVRTMTVRTGKKLVELAVRVVGDCPDVSFLETWRQQITLTNTPGTFPVALAVVFSALKLSPECLFMVHQYGVAMAILGAAMRLMKVDHFDTQSILFKLNKNIEQDYELASQKTLGDMSSFTPTIDLLAAIHVKAHVRLFMN